ncbi:MAG: Exopolysaccharide biosynthesis polyprenyl glycosylphosphotransferase [Candidatus Moranbacteria bacterium GW2011_GWE2_35_2-]|nr:MAG: Exopolysaccharide biosynthesis polyprenyl glycosylphosphotransferase [Candidatus Moranbacteria bacterium GW2011_GWE2_35_2-]KKQ05204.1 MAG: Exopolysaccharide biosynthesis polyprenyl glycosylphosphotransferase [Candidatus Moranbacteria bacterium GW2011_GWF1_36_4]KKQ22973.1 MAG: Exopolysaccharide biosynthesis polyprenyl glycosylphosphotransferase [Candidatus Moranbacteria bacterium GW2011_GWF2_37_11]KKQ29331.1 MAG: Exopolysaccharide biosynthesis polyprenyl glycosylphosphotransferase [Candid
MKRSELFFSAIQVPADFAMIVLGAISAFFIRENLEVTKFFNLQPLKFHNVHFEEYINIVFISVPFFLLIYALEGLYDIRATRKFWKETFKVFTATSIGLVIIIIAIFLKREWFSSRFIILAAWFIAVFYVVAARYILHRIQLWLLKSRGIGIHRVLLIGHNGKVKEISRMIRRNRNLGYRIVDIINTAQLKVIKQIKKEKGVDEVILCSSSIPDDELEKLIDFCAINNISYKFVPTTLQTSKYKIGVLGGEPIIEVLHTPLDGWGRITKRIFDIIFSVVLIILTFPIMLLVALLIKLEDRNGPIIYKNERIGAEGIKFFAYKFRYMKWEYSISKDNPNFEKAFEFEKKLITERSVRQGPLYKIKDDPRKTKVGRFIEKYSIDEFPQFFNVLFGSMSLIGPRPHQKREVEKYMEYHRRLLTIKPGVTGMAQVSGRSDLDFEDEYKLDLFYIENWSLTLDIQIIFKTIGVLLHRRKNNSN